MSLIVTTCLACGQTDDHPKDQVILPPDHSSVFYHMDCHAAMEPPCLGCRWLVQHKGELRGQDWREQILSLHEVMPPEQRELPPHERDAVEGHLDGARR